MKASLVFRDATINPSMERLTDSMLESVLKVFATCDIQFDAIKRTEKHCEAF